MSKNLMMKALSTAVPVVLGFLGGLSSTFFPAYFAAFCTGSM